MSNDQEELDKQAFAFMESVIGSMPDNLKAEHVIVLCRQVITDYAADDKEAMLWLVALSSMLKEYYSGEGPEESLCDCDECTAARKRKIN